MARLLAAGARVIFGEIKNSVKRQCIREDFISAGRAGQSSSEVSMRLRALPKGANKNKAVERLRGRHGDDGAYLE